MGGRGRKTGKGEDPVSVTVTCAALVDQLKEFCRTARDAGDRGGARLMEYFAEAT